MPRRRSYSSLELAERRFPWRVNIIVPELALQQRLTAGEFVDHCVSGAKDRDRPGSTGCSRASFGGSST
jgi:hypothetical protein